MASVCLLDLFAKYLQQAGRTFHSKKDKNVPMLEATEVSLKRSVGQCRAPEGLHGKQPDRMEVKHV